MALLLAQALLSNPLACVCFWLLGVVLGSLSRWCQRPVGSGASPATPFATDSATKPGIAPDPDLSLSPPSSSAASEAGDLPARDVSHRKTHTPGVSPPRTPPPGSLRARHSTPQEHPHASLPAPRHPWYVHEREARDVVARVVAQDRGEEAGWSHMMDKQVTHKYTYSAYRRTLPSGLTEYRTITTFADTTPIELMEFLLDDSARKQWEGFLTLVEVLLTGDWLGGREQVVRWVRRFPFHFLSDREYIMARKAWVLHEGGHDLASESAELLPLTTITPGAPLVAVTKGLNTHPAAPVSSTLVRTLDFQSSWVCRAGPDPWGRPCMAAQVVLLHTEAIQISEYLARTAVSMGMSKFVKDLAGGLEAFRTQRRDEGVPLHSLDLEAYGHDHASDALARAEHQTVDILTHACTPPEASAALETQRRPDMKAEGVAAMADGVAVLTPVTPPPGWHMTAATRAASGDVRRVGASSGGAGFAADPYRRGQHSKWKRAVRLALAVAATGAVVSFARKRGGTGGTGTGGIVSSNRKGRGHDGVPAHGQPGLVAHALSDLDLDLDLQDHDVTEDRQDGAGLEFSVSDGVRDARSHVGKLGWW